MKINSELFYPELEITFNADPEVHNLSYWYDFIYDKWKHHIVIKDFNEKNGKFWFKLKFSVGLTLNEYVNKKRLLLKDFDIAGV